MNRLEWFEKFKESLHHGLKLGLISSGVYGKFLGYTVFLEINKTKMRTAAVKETAELMKCSPGNIWQSIDFFENSPQSDLSDFILPPDLTRESTESIDLSQN